MKKFLDLPPELFSIICNQYLSLTRDKMTFGLVCKRTREVVNWQEHYLDFDMTQEEGTLDLLLNGSPYCLTKWPLLVQVLLEKPDLTISKISIHTSDLTSDQNELNGAAIVHQIADILSQFQAKIQLKAIRVVPYLKGDDNTPNKEIRFAIDYMLYNIGPNCFKKIEIFNIANVSEVSHILPALEGKALKVLRLDNVTMDQNFDPVALCNGLKPRCLESLDLGQNWTVEQLQAFRNHLGSDIVSELQECSFVVDCSFTQMRDMVIPLITTWFPKLIKCHLAVFGEEPNAQVTGLCASFFEMMTQLPLFHSAVLNLDEPQLPACQMELLLAQLRATYPEMDLTTDMDSCICFFDLANDEDGMLPKQQVKDGIGFNIGRYICENPQCQVCHQDSSLLLREIQFLHDQAKAMGEQVVHPGPGGPSPLHLFSLRICELEEMQGQLQMLLPTTNFTVLGNIAENEDNMFVVLDFNWPDESTTHGFFRIVVCNVENCSCKDVAPE